MLKRVVSFLALFSSLSTLICCALPALLVSLGLGATLASSLAVFPQLIWLSEHKTMVFSFAGIMLLLAYFLRRYSATQSCPLESEGAQACGEARSLSTFVFYFSLLMYLIGLFFAYIAPILNE